MLLQYSIENKFVSGVTFWVFYLGLGFIVAALLPAILNDVAPGPYIVGFLPFTTVVSAVTPAALCLVTGASGIAYAFTYKTKIMRIVLTLVGVGLVLTGLYLLTWQT